MPAFAATTERIVVNTMTGMAIDGFDPVAYFTDRTPQLGDGDFEYAYRGAVWRFSNEGNRDAFVRDPGVYMPRFGGYDPVALARSVARPGHPMIWLILSERLYLFRTVANRDAFAAGAEQSVAAAERGWRELAPTLVP